MSSRICEGQRWLSESEPELGLGQVKEVTARHLVMWFSGGEVERRYARGNAPLRRIQFRPGDEVEAIDGSTFLVDKVEERGGLYFYHGEGDSMCEILLSHHMRLDAPEERIGLGQWASSKDFDLRCEALEMRSEWMASNIRGLLGARASLLPHQLYVAHEASLRQNPRLLLADETGLGKTIEAGLILHQLRQTERADRILLLLPEPLLHQWFVEMLRRFHLIFRVLDERHCAERAIDAPDANPFAEDQLCICSLDWLANNPERSFQAMTQEWDVIVCDEAHHVEAGTPAYDLLTDLAEDAWGLLLLTATPEQHGNEHHFARLQLLDPARYTDAEAFLHDHQGYQDLAALATTLLDPTQPLPEGVEARIKASEPELLAALENAATQSEEERQDSLDTLLDRYGLGRVMFRNTRARIKGFPERIVKMHPLPCKPPKGSTEAPALAKDPRLAWLVELIQNVQISSIENEKLLLIATEQATVVALHKALQEELAIEMTLFHEGLSLLERDRNAVYFADPEGADLMLCSALGGEGRNFQAARHLILFDLPDDPEQLDQRIGRLDRIGQGASIEIHVPYLEGTAQALMAHWYHDALDAFSKPCLGGHQTYTQLRERLEGACEGFWLDPANQAQRDALLAESATIHATNVEALSAGRDQLLALSSFDPAKGEALRDEVETLHENPDHQETIRQLFEHFGVEIEALTEETFKLEPGVKLHEGFPWLQNEPMQVTFDRDFALQHPTTQFISLEHPMVVGALELLLGSPDSSCNVCKDPDAKEQAFWLEGLFVWECTAPQRLNVGRFVPPTPMRIVVNHQGELVEESERAGAATHKASKRWLGHKVLFRELVPTMLKACRAQAELQQPKQRRAFQQRAEQRLGPELARLRYLQGNNPDVSKKDVDLAERELDQVHRAIGKAQLRLDGLRLHLRGVDKPS